MGDRGKFFYIILEGEVKIECPYNDEEEKDLLYDKAMLTHEVGRRYPGQTFGEIALLNLTARTATVQAVTSAHFACLTKADYDETL